MAGLDGRQDSLSIAIRRAALAYDVDQDEKFVTLNRVDTSKLKCCYRESVATESS